MIYHLQWMINILYGRLTNCKWAYISSIKIDWLVKWKWVSKFLDNVYRTYSMLSVTQSYPVDTFVDQTIVIKINFSGCAICFYSLVCVNWVRLGVSELSINSYQNTVTDLYLFFFCSTEIAQKDAYNCQISCIDLYSTYTEYINKLKNSYFESVSKRTPYTFLV